MPKIGFLVESESENNSVKTEEVKPNNKEQNERSTEGNSDNQL